MLIGHKVNIVGSHFRQQLSGMNKKSLSFVLLSLPVTLGILPLDQTQELQCIWEGHEHHGENSPSLSKFDALNIPHRFVPLRWR